MNDSPHTKLVSGGYSAKGRDRSLFVPTLPDSDYICTKKGNEDGSCFVCWFLRPCFSLLKMTQYESSIKQTSSMRLQVSPAFCFCQSHGEDLIFQFFLKGHILKGWPISFKHLIYFTCNGYEKLTSYMQDTVAFSTIAEDKLGLQPEDSHIVSKDTWHTSFIFPSSTTAGIAVRKL